MNYFDELKRSMDWLSEKPNTLFLDENNVVVDNDLIIKRLN